MKKSFLPITLLLALAACNNCTEDKNNIEINESEKVEELQHKLDATEAQLLNIRTELAKCKGDSLSY